MRPSFSSTVLQRNLVLAVPLTVMAWAVAVPGFLTFSNFVALTALLAGCAWLVNTIYLNAHPTNSLARVVHETDAGARGGTTHAPDC